MMRKLTILILVIVLFSFSNSANIYAADPSCSAGENQVAYIGSTLEITVENLPVGEYTLWVYRDVAMWIDEAFVSGREFTQSTEGKTIELKTSIGTEWPEYPYVVTINTPSSTLKPRGDVITKCYFILHPETDNPDSSSVVTIEPKTCMGGEGLETALGCIPIKPDSFVKYLVNFAIGIGGGIAFLLIIFGSFQIIFSGGNPDKLKAGKEIITAALGGLLLIIFSVLILRLIGYDILNLPGFGK
jgi:hypothetical protein